MTSSITRKPLTVWRLLDGKVGHEKQSQALIEGLKALHNNLISIDIAIDKPALLYWRCWVFNMAFTTNVKRPDIVIGVGHKTHIALLAVKRNYKCKSIVIMSPSLPFFLFDIVIAPQHDFLKKKIPSNTITTLTALAPLTKSNPIYGKGLILLGGESKHFYWDDTQLSNHIKTIIRSSPEDFQWKISNSRRTPKSTSESVNKLCSNQKNANFFDYRTLSIDWLTKQLEDAAHIYVTIDSASMIAEALNTSAQLHLIDLKGKKSENKHHQSIFTLKQKGLISEINTIKNTTRPPLNQQIECAEKVLNRIFRDEFSD